MHIHFPPLGFALGCLSVNQRLCGTEPESPHLPVGGNPGWWVDWMGAFMEISSFFPFSGPGLFLLDLSPGSEKRGWGGLLIRLLVTLYREWGHSLVKKRQGGERTASTQRPGREAKESQTQRERHSEVADLSLAPRHPQACLLRLT